jgi:cytochrome c-type biogenesis protein CcmH
MNFWIYAIALLAVSAAAVGWPLLAGAAKEKITGLFILLILPLAGILMYQAIGTPEAINTPSAAVAQRAAQQSPAHSEQQGQMEELVASLQQRMNENPDDPEGWLILGRSLKTMQRYADAEIALGNANRLVPGNPAIMIELAETMLFTSGQPEVSDEARQLIEAALAVDPNQQKGLWIMGMASAQEGDDTQAIAYWQKLLGLLEPASGPHQAVTEQIEMAQTRMGQAPVATQTAAVEPAVEEPVEVTPAMTKPAETSPPATEGFGIPVTVSIGDGMSASIPSSAALFIFVHPSGAAGMPLAVKRLAPRGFPMTLNFTDADLLRPGGSLQDFEKLDISARISMAGIANGASGDIQANRVTIDTNNVSAIALNLDQRVP